LERDSSKKIQPNPKIRRVIGFAPDILQCNEPGGFMANRFGTDILIQAIDPKAAAAFYTNILGFEIDDRNPNMIGLHGDHINLFIEPGPPLGPVLEVTVDDVEKATARLVKAGCVVVKDEPDFPRRYVKDPYGLIYNLTK
jgi:predicted enzyme related to lactoylglutathione lyase